MLLQSLFVYTNDTMKVMVDNISIDAPLGWMVQYTKSPQLLFLYSPVEENDDLQENCNIMLEYLPAPYTVEEYKDASVEAIKAVYTDLQLIESQDNYQIFTGYIGTINVMQIQYIYIKSDIAYVLTFTSNPDNFDRYLEQFVTIAESFTY